MIQKIYTKEATRFYNTCIFWVITLIPIAAYNLFYKIDVISIHNVILPIILLASLFNYIESLLKENNKENSIENYII